MSFLDILGQEKPISLLQKQILKHKVPHAYIFSGIEGTGRKKTAFELAKALNCINKTAESLACGECASCRKITGGNHPDVHLIDFSFQAAFLDEEPEKQTRIKMDTIREVQKQIGMKASEGRWKIFIIDPADKLNIEAANCLLKTLEEPPENSLLVLISASPDSLPKTISSRCQQVRFNRLSNTAIAEIINQTSPEKTGGLESIIQFSEGSVSKALNCLENPDDITDLIKFWEQLKTNNVSPDMLLDYSETLSKDKRLLEDFITKALVMAQSEPMEDPGKSGIIEFILSCKKAMRYNVNTSLLSDMLLLKLNGMFQRSDTPRSS